MIGWRAARDAKPEDWRLRLLHWNVWWGGLAIESRAPWNKIGKEIIDKNPDLIVLSEAPFTLPLYRKLDQMPGRHFGLSVLSLARGSTSFTSSWQRSGRFTWNDGLRSQDGGAAVVRMAHPARPIRILVVDGAQHDHPATHADAPRSCQNLCPRGRAGCSHRPDRGRFQRRQPIDRL